MADEDYDCIVLGQGLAGTCLAWQVRWRGWRMLAIDRGEPVTASRIAAGLITPVTGKRLARTWGWDEFWPEAIEFYRRVEAETGRSCFHEAPSVRLFQSAEERQYFENTPDRAGTLTFNVGAERFHAGWGGFEMKPAGRLDVSGFLDASRRVFQGESRYLEEDVDLENDVAWDGDGVVLPRLGLRARRLICCQGFTAVRRWFAPIRFNPAQGEILEVIIPGLSEQRVLHRGLWLAPLGQDCYRVGATYDWNRLDQLPTSAGRDELCRRLREFVRLPFEIVSQYAAVRPTMHDFRPVLGQHPEFPQLSIFNGLGSKGSLMAPLLSRWLMDLLGDGTALDSQLDVRRWFR